ncbi:MAG: hypothetical protein RCG15_01500 [Candidatus Rickettsia vulgarisii]
MPEPIKLLIFHSDKNEEVEEYCKWHNHQNSDCETTGDLIQFIRSMLT